MASSLTDAISGMVRMPTPMPAAMRLNWLAPEKRFWTNSGEITLMAKNPRTTLGMPASTSMPGLSTRRTLGGAYSDR